jgi:hypothetical protein
MFFAPFGSEYTAWNTALAPVPELGVTATAAGAGVGVGVGTIAGGVGVAAATALLSTPHPTVANIDKEISARASIHRLETVPLIGDLLKHTQE